MRDPVANRRDAQWTLTAVRFGDHGAPHGLSLVGFVFQITGQFPQQRFYPDSVLYGFEADPINAGTPGDGKTPGVMEDTSELILW